MKVKKATKKFHTIVVNETSNVFCSQSCPSLQEPDDNGGWREPSAERSICKAFGAGLDFIKALKKTIP